MNETQTKSTVLLKHHLKQLKLPTMLAECEKIAQRAPPTTRSLGVSLAALRVGVDRTGTAGCRGV